MRGSWPLVSGVGLATLLTSCAEPPPLTLCEADRTGQLVNGNTVRVSAPYTHTLWVDTFRDDRCPQVDASLIFRTGEETAQRFEDETAKDISFDDPVQRYQLDVTGRFHQDWESVGPVILVDRINAYERINEPPAPSLRPAKVKG